jgi:putative ABC transport system ATP-binding protein
MTMLSLSRVSKVFHRGTANEAKALDSLDLEVAEGDFITIIGSNGAGKSTLI